MDCTPSILKAKQTVYSVESHNLKSLGVEISKYRKLNYREVDIRIYNSPKMIIIFFPFENMFCVCKRNVSGRHFFYPHKTCFYK